MSWYWEMHQRVEDGEDIINLTIEKFEKWLDREIDLLGMSSGECPLCVKVARASESCDECILSKYTMKCEEEGSLHDRLDFIFWHGLRDDVENLIKEEILPLLRKIKEETD